MRAAATLVGILVACNGCSTILTQVGYGLGERFPSDVMVYSGTQLNVLLVSQSFEIGPFTVPKVHGLAGPGIMGFVDFLPSLALDTVLLPVTAIETLVSRSTVADQERHKPVKGTPE